MLPGVLPPLLLLLTLFWAELGAALGIGPPALGVLFCWLYGADPGAELGGVACCCWLEPLELVAPALLEGCS